MEKIAEESQEKELGNLPASDEDSTKKQPRRRPRRHVRAKMRPKSEKQVKTQAKESPISQAGKADTKTKAKNISLSGEKSQKRQSTKTKKATSINKKSQKKSPLETRSQAPRSKKIATEQKPKDRAISSSAVAKKPKGPARKGWWQVGS